MKKLLIFLLLSFLFITPLYAADKKGNLIFYDQIAKPGETIYLKAKLRGGGFLLKPDIGGEMVEFFQSINKSKKSLGSTLTGGDGVAVKKMQPLNIGRHSFTARLADTKRFTADESTGIIFCWDQTIPVIIVDMDALSNIEKVDFIFQKIEKDSKPRKDASKVLKKLSRNYNIIYLTNKDELVLNKTRLWLKENEFPLAPVFSINASKDSIAEEYGGRIKEWKKEGWNIKIGIGNTAPDAEAYLDNGMKAIIIENEEELPDKAAEVKGWKEIERKISRIRR